MADFVLVPGAWHGSWCWDRVAPLLVDRGHRVFPITLTGLSERADTLSRHTDLSTHIADVVKLVEGEDLRNAVLAGHSYGGQVISGAVQQLKSRLRHVVYLDALLPMSGENCFDVGVSVRIRNRAMEHGDGWLIPTPDLIDGKLVGVSDPEDIDWLRKNLTDHPLATFEEKVRLDPISPHPVPGTYVLCAPDGNSSPTFRTSVERACTLGWPVVEVDTGHDLMVTEPDQTASILLSALGD